MVDGKTLEATETHSDFHKNEANSSICIWLGFISKSPEIDTHQTHIAVYFCFIEITMTRCSFRGVMHVTRVAFSLSNIVLYFRD